MSGQGGGPGCDLVSLFKSVGGGTSPAAPPGSRAHPESILRPRTRKGPDVGPVLQFWRLAAQRGHARAQQGGGPRGPGLGAEQD